MCTRNHGITGKGRTGMEFLSRWSPGSGPSLKTIVDASFAFASKRERRVNFSLAGETRESFPWAASLIHCWERFGTASHHKAWLVVLPSAGMLQQDQAQDRLSTNAYLNEFWYHSVDLKRVQLKSALGEIAAALPTLEGKHHKPTPTVRTELENLWLTTAFHQGILGPWDIFQTYHY